MLIFQKFPCILQNLFPWTYSTFQLTESIKILYLEWTYMIILLFPNCWKIGLHSVCMCRNHQNMDCTSHQLCNTLRFGTLQEHITMLYGGRFHSSCLWHCVNQWLDTNISRQCSVLTFMGQNVMECFTILKKDCEQVLIFVPDRLEHMITTFHGTDIMSTASVQSTYTD